MNNRDRYLRGNQPRERHLNRTIDSRPEVIENTVGLCTDPIPIVSRLLEVRAFAVDANLAE